MSDFPAPETAGKIHFYCVFCGVENHVEASGSYTACPCRECHRITPVPPPAEFAQDMPSIELYPSEIFSVDIKFPCPKCKTRLDVDARNAGVPGFCPSCGGEIECPQLPAFLLRGSTAGTKPEPPVIHLTREEIEFLSPPGVTPEKTATHAP